MEENKNNEVTVTKKEIKPETTIKKEGRYMDSKHMSLSPVLSKSKYVRYNKIIESRSPITATQRVISEMLNCTNISNALLPMVVKSAPHAPDWYNKITDHWKGFVHPPINMTLILDISFIYNEGSDRYIFDKKVKEAYDEYIALTKVNPISEAQYFMDYHLAILKIEDEKNTIVDGKPKYGTPVNRDHYLFWLVCLLLGSVAKRSEDLDKSNNIRFLLEDPTQAKLEQEKKQNIKSKAEKLFYTIDNDQTKINNIIWLVATGNVNKLSFEDKKRVIREYIDLNPQTFIDLCNDKQLSERAYLEQLISLDILKRIGNTGIIIDTMDSTVKIGNNIEEALVYLNNPTAETKGNIDNYTARYNQLTK